MKLAALQSREDVRDLQDFVFDAKSAQREDRVVEARRLWKQATQLKRQIVLDTTTPKSLVSLAGGIR